MKARYCKTSPHQTEQKTALGPVTDMRTCIQLACDVGGDVAYMRSSQCFVITCHSPALCDTSDRRAGSSDITTSVALLRKRGQSNIGHGIKDVGSKSLNHKANNVFRTDQAPITPSNTSTPLPPKSSEIPHSSSKTEKISNNNSNISKAISSASLPSSQNADDTSELSGLYHLISFQDVVNSARKVNHPPTPSITASRRYEPHSRHRDLATTLAEAGWIEFSPFHVRCFYAESTNILDS
ncbi:hypothetical protein OS493_034673 [Desmophyllum pertusum]|uniref:Uncharacterized protein n=1 Tax=Desmophyllum pertusum TaxID=174260 RepID=A0A9W9ZJI8_9CNID|nr:hypothetical protein OS493_034673 [Desmophyllum pertusum]